MESERCDSMEGDRVLTSGFAEESGRRGGSHMCSSPCVGHQGVEAMHSGLEK